MVVALIASLAAIAVPVSEGMISDIRIRGDAQTLSGTLALTKMTAAAKFTRARLNMNVVTGTYRIEVWQRTGTPGWVTESGELRLSSQDLFGSGSLTAPPPNTQAVLAQAPPCRDADAEVIVNTACVIYNSRGIPVSFSGAPVTTQVVYLRGPTGAFAVAIGPTGQQQVWRTNLAAGGAWVQQ